MYYIPYCFSGVRSPATDCMLTNSTVETGVSRAAKGRRKRQDNAAISVTSRGEIAVSGSTREINSKRQSLRYVESCFDVLNRGNIDSRLIDGACNSYACIMECLGEYLLDPEKRLLSLRACNAIHDHGALFLGTPQRGKLD